MTELDDLIDLMEGEMEASEVQEMELLFRHSPADRRAFLNLHHLREAVEATDPLVKLRADQQKRLQSIKYQNKLTQKIMDQIFAHESANQVSQKKPGNFLKPVQDPSGS